MTAVVVAEPPSVNVSVPLWFHAIFELVKSAFAVT